MAEKATLVTFREQFPEFSDTLDEEIERALFEAKLIHSFRPLATLYLTAHLLTFASMTDEGTPVTGGTNSVTTSQSRSAGPFTVTESSTNNSLTQVRDGIDRTIFTSTRYGQQFLTLEARSVEYAIAFRVV